ncbi:MAG: tetratricopeptide repeat protein [Trueperaceae bacterium]|nr:tetratricopeptide repeat protein [Trueperaceae bacterium]
MMTSRTHRTVRPILAVFLATVLMAFSAAAAQAEPTRIVIVPLQGPSELSTWSLGLSAGLGRSLNAIDGVYAPPIGDALILANRASEAGLDTAAVLHERFRAASVLGGRVASAPSGIDLTLERYGNGGVQASETITLPEAPAEAFPRAVELAIEVLGLAPGSDAREAALATAAQAPSVPSLQAVALSMSRLPGPGPSELRAAQELDPDSSWVASERARVTSGEDMPDVARESAVAATDAEPRDVEAWAVRGAVHLQAGEDAEAERAYQEALSRNAVHATARTGMAQLRSGQDRIRELERAIDAYPRMLDAQLALADALGGARGVRSLRSAAEVLPDSVTLHAEVVAHVLRAGDAGGALAYLRQAAEEPLARRPGLYGLAARLPSSVSDGALAFLREGREAFPDDTALVVAEAGMLLDRDDPAAAEEVLRPAFEAAPDDPRVANELALALAAQDRPGEAREVLQAAAEGSATVRFNLGQALLEAGRPSAAAEELGPLMESDPEDAEAWAVYGTALAGAGRLEEAQEALDRALSLDAEQPLAQRTQRRLEERERIAGEGADPLPRGAQAPFDRGLAALEQGRFQEAATEFGRAYDAAPDRPIVAFYLANALQRAGSVEEALDAYAPALEAFGDSGTVLNNVGFAHLQLGRYDRALPTLRDAVDASPENARAHLNLGLTYYGLSRYQDALASWDRATELDPSLASSIADVRERAQQRAGGAGE